MNYNTDKERVMILSEALDQVGGDEEFLTEVLANLLEEAEGYIGRIGTAISNFDMDGAGRQGHYLKGSANSLSCLNLRDIGLDIQNLGHKWRDCHDTEVLAPACAQMSDLLAALRVGCDDLKIIVDQRQSHSVATFLEDKSQDGVKLLLRACIGGDDEAVQQLLSSEVPVDGCDAVRLACRNLVAFDVVSAQYKRTGLMTAAESGHLGIIGLLLDKGASKELTAKEGKCAFSYAVEHSRWEVAKLVMPTNPSEKDWSKYCMGLVLKLGKVADYSFEELSAHYFTLWALLVSTASESLDTDTISSVCKNYVTMYPQLYGAQDVNGRAILEMALPAVRKEVESLFLWYGHFRVPHGIYLHKSHTCIVYEAIDEREALAPLAAVRPGSRPSSASSSGPSPLTTEFRKYARVALKIMTAEKQYLTEMSVRKYDFDEKYVMKIVFDFVPPGSSLMEEAAQLQETASASTSAAPAASSMRNSFLDKLTAESRHCIAMPLAERNLFVAMKQERFAGIDFAYIGFVMRQLVECVMHVHSKGILHGDLKPLNIVRHGGNWMLIDFDAACVIGHDPVCEKFSSAYVPPEAIYTDSAAKVAFVRSKSAFESRSLVVKEGDLLVAHPSFDVWSLGCVFYQLCSHTVNQLFLGDRDDNLTADARKEDNLWKLSVFSDNTKHTKLEQIHESSARNLASHMLTKDPTARITLDRILQHPFISGKHATRLKGEEPEFDVFISYRVATDEQIASLLYTKLTEAGVKVWWDKACLQQGEKWETGFCRGLVNSKSFVCLLSRASICSVDNPRCDWSKLTPSSSVDNVLLEYRLALELRSLGMLEKIFPVVTGDKHVSLSTEFPVPGIFHEYVNFAAFRGVADVAVAAVEEKVRVHMGLECLGSPLEPNKTARSVVQDLLDCQGAKIEGERSLAVSKVADDIAKMVQRPAADANNAPGKDGVVSAGLSQGGPDSDRLDELMQLLNMQGGRLDSLVELVQSLPTARNNGDSAGGASSAGSFFEKSSN